jgi:hypothetical protein
MYSQMLPEADHTKIFEAMEIKISNHENCCHWDLMLRRDLPLGTKTIMAIWLFKCKQFPNGTLNKNKAQLCAHGGQQTWGQDYWDTYVHVRSWASVRLLLIVAEIHGLELKSINFVLAFSQADLDAPVYMELPAGVNPDNVSDGDLCIYILKPNKSLYGLKQDGYNWFEKLREGLITRDFIQSQVDKYVFFWNDCIVLTYVDDCIILGKDMAIIDAVISLLKEGHKDFKLVDQGIIDKYLGLMIQDIDSNTFKMRQPFLICCILDFLLLNKNRQKDKKLRLESHCSITTWMVFLGSTRGYIVEELACSVILLIVSGLRFRWPCIKLLFLD